MGWVLGAVATVLTVVATAVALALEVVLRAIAMLCLAPQGMLDIWDTACETIPRLGRRLAVYFSGVAARIGMPDLCTSLRTGLAVAAQEGARRVLLVFRAMVEGIQRCLAPVREFLTSLFPKVGDWLHPKVATPVFVSTIRVPNLRYNTLRSA